MGKSPSTGARRTAAAEIKSNRLLEGEDPSTEYPEDAVQWIRVYEELITFKERMLVRMYEELRAVSKAARQELNDQDVSRFEAQRDGYIIRREFWQERRRELRGIDLDPDTRALRHNGSRTILTRRQYQLFALLLDNPGRPYKAKELATAAWKRPDLSAEQVRSYVVQLRQILLDLGLPCRIVSQPRQGYVLDFEEAAVA